MAIAGDYFTHDMARSRCYRWGEDGILGIADRECRLCSSLVLSGTAAIRSSKSECSA